MFDRIFSNINKIIERDSKATTYKFALLRGVIDIIQDNSPYIFLTDEKASIPTGLLIEKWLLYYYPIIDSDIPQIHGESSLAFNGQFRKLILAYSRSNGFSEFYNDLRNKGIPPSLCPDFKALARQLYKTITGMPMKHIGYSLNNGFYSIFSYEKPHASFNPHRIDIDFLIFNFGSFSIPIEYYNAFKLLGSFINGQDSILFKWAEFSVNASRKNLTIENVISNVLKNPVTERDALESKQIYRNALTNDGKLTCVWTGRPLSDYHVDHVIPFSVWRNNDLWNLLPTHPAINNRKKDKIPSVELVEKRKEMIFYYWHLNDDFCHERFHREMKFSLLGNNDAGDWKAAALEKLQKNCQYLISERGYEEWKI
jgi:5-methylcytosine-specific restriction endonuclease McrA